VYDKAGEDIQEQEKVIIPEMISDIGQVGLPEFIGFLWSLMRVPYRMAFLEDVFTD
jgi:hypothetical protein